MSESDIAIIIEKLDGIDGRLDHLDKCIHDVRNDLTQSRQEVNGTLEAMLGQNKLILSRLENQDKLISRALDKLS